MKRMRRLCFELSLTKVEVESTLMARCVLEAVVLAHCEVGDAVLEAIWRCGVFQKWMEHCEVKQILCDVLPEGTTESSIDQIMFELAHHRLYPKKPDEVRERLETCSLDTIDAQQLTCLCSNAAKDWTACSSDTDVVLLLGLRGSGKSLMLQFLAGADVREVTLESGKAVIKCMGACARNEDAGMPALKTAPIACGQHPMLLVDVPSSGDDLKQVYAAVQLAALMQSARSVRFVLLLRRETLTHDRGSHLPADIEAVLAPLRVAWPKTKSSLLTLIWATSAVEPPSNVHDLSIGDLLATALGCVGLPPTRDPLSSCANAEAFCDEYLSELRLQIVAAMRDPLRPSVRAHVASPLSIARTMYHQLIASLPPYSTCDGTDLSVLIPSAMADQLQTLVAGHVNHFAEELERGANMTAFASAAASAYSLFEAFSVFGRYPSIFEKPLNRMRQHCADAWSTATKHLFSVPSQILNTDGAIEQQWRALVTRCVSMYQWMTFALKSEDVPAPSLDVVGLSLRDAISVQLAPLPASVAGTVKWLASVTGARSLETTLAAAGMGLRDPLPSAQAVASFHREIQCQIAACQSAENILEPPLEISVLCACNSMLREHFTNIDDSVQTSLLELQSELRDHVRRRLIDALQAAATDEEETFLELFFNPLSKSRWGLSELEANSMWLSCLEGARTGISTTEECRLLRGLARRFPATYGREYAAVTRVVSTVASAALKRLLRQCRSLDRNGLDFFFDDVAQLDAHLQALGGASTATLAQLLSGVKVEAFPTIHARLGVLMVLSMLCAKHDHQELCSAAQRTLESWTEWLDAEATPILLFDQGVVGATLTQRIGSVAIADNLLTLANGFTDFGDTWHRHADVRVAQAALSCFLEAIQEDLVCRRPHDTETLRCMALNVISFTPNSPPGKCAVAAMSRELKSFLHSSIRKLEDCTDSDLHDDAVDVIAAVVAVFGTDDDTAMDLDDDAEEPWRSRLDAFRCVSKEYSKSTVVWLKNVARSGFEQLRAERVAVVRRIVAVRSKALQERIRNLIAKVLIDHAACILAGDEREGCEAVQREFVDVATFLSQGLGLQSSALAEAIANTAAMRLVA